MTGRRAKWCSALAVGLAALTFAACGDDEEEGGGGGGGAASDGAAELTGPLFAAGWGATYDEATLKHFGGPFEQETGVELKMVPVTSGHAARVDAQQRAGKVEWDLLDSVTASDAFRLHKNGHLETLPPDLKTKLTEELGEGKVTDFGFTIGTVGTIIVCNAEKMPTCPENMQEFFDVEKFPQDRMLPGLNPIALATAGMLASGTPAADVTSSPIDLDKAFEALDRIKSKTKVFFESGEQMRQALRSGEVDLALAWSGSAYQVENQGTDLTINWNEGIYEAGYWTVVKDAPHKDAALKFLESVATRPEDQAKWSQDLGYGVPHPDAVQFMPEEAQAAVPENPANFDKLVAPNYDWYVEGENAAELDKRMQEFLRG